jgi:hypothetical protein
MTRITLAVICTLAAACSSTSRQSPSGACAGQYDGCVIGGVLGGLPDGGANPYQSGNPDQDGKGRFYAALMDACPSATNRQIKFVSDVATLEHVDFTLGVQSKFDIGFFFNDTRFNTTYSENDTVAMSGFLDDNGSVLDPSTAAPDINDTVVGCMEVALRAGSNQLVAPLVPCLLLQAEPHVFSQPAFAAEQCAPIISLIDQGAN